MHGFNSFPWEALVASQHPRPRDCSVHPLLDKKLPQRAVTSKSHHHTAFSLPPPAALPSALSVFCAPLLLPRLFSQVCWWQQQAWETRPCKLEWQQHEALVLAPLTALLSWLKALAPGMVQAVMSAETISNLYLLAAPNTGTITGARS